MFVLKVDQIDILRGKQNLTLEQLAARGGRHTSTLCNAMANGGRCHPRTAGWIAEALGVRIEDIADFERK